MTDQIDYIEFPSSDREATGQFFVAAFGWSLTSYGPDYSRQLWDRGRHRPEFGQSGGSSGDCPHHGFG